MKLTKKILGTTGIISLMSFLPAGQSMAAATITATGLNFRPTSQSVPDGLYPNQGTSTQGGTNTGLLRFASGPGTGTTAPAGNNDLGSYNFVWSGLDIDGVGGTNDYINFTISVTATGGSGTVRFDGQGLGVTGGINSGLQSGETLSFTLTSVSSNVGSVTSFGFTGAGYGTSASTASGPTTATSSADINGVTVTNDLAGTTEGYRYFVKEIDFASTQTVLFNNIVHTSGTADPTGWARTFDLSFTHDVVPEPSTFALCGLGLLGFVARRRR
ncbi:PEP-CTERM sorting domain-containing protein [Luteolibacter algae]|uniref:PEP-CTERM sorting domain-containing protein n=1 Tax=Luteolibacter algae TaxID=454151 RepID=A0ABW5D5N6_9BACT